MKNIKFLFGIFYLIILMSCPYLFPPDCNATLYVYVIDSIDSTYIENADVYFLPNLTDYSDSLGLTGRFNFNTDINRYWGPVDEEIPSGFIYTKAFGYQSDTTQIGKTDCGDFQNVYVYLKER